jgi:ribonuclease BN (tRNA processing enzyme)
LLLRFHDTEGHSLVFSGDTAPGEDLLQASRDADLLVVECSTSNAWALEGHMNPERVIDVCVAARPHRVALTHQYPDAAGKDLATPMGDRLGIPVIQLSDGDRLAVPETKEPTP